MPRTTELVAEGQNSASEAVSLDDRIKLVLAAIEGETVPDRLLELGMALEQALAERKQKLRPN